MKTMESTIDLNIGYLDKVDFTTKLPLISPAYFLIGGNGNYEHTVCDMPLNFGGLGIILNPPTHLLYLPANNLLGDISELIMGKGNIVEAAELIMWIEPEAGGFIASSLSHNKPWYFGEKQLHTYASVHDFTSAGTAFELIRYGGNRPLKLSAKILSNGNKGKLSQTYEPDKINLESPLEYSQDLFYRALRVDFPNVWKTGNKLRSGSVKILTEEDIYIVTSTQLNINECNHLLQLCKYLSNQPNADPGKRDSLHRTMNSIKVYSGQT